MPGQSLTELFTRGTPPASFPLGSSAAAQSSRRRMSITTSLGLNGASGSWQGSALGSLGRRRGSSSVSASDSSGSPFSAGSLEENAIEEDTATSRTRSGSNTNEPTTPVSPFARRMSFSARAYGDLRGQAGDAGGGGFNWNEHSRQRAESTVERGLGGRLGLTAAAGKRVAAVAPEVQPKPETKVLEERPVLVAQKVKAPAKPRRQLSGHEERMLKGDFMMD